MEGESGGPQLPMPSRSWGALPAPLLVVVTFSWLILATAIVSGAHYDEAYRLVLWPPSGESLGDFLLQFAGSLVGLSLSTAALALLLALVPASLAGYFLALKAPERVRRWGLFAVFAAWILSLPRAIASLTLWLSPWSDLVPWWPMLANAPRVALSADLALPPIALAVYSSLRGYFLGLPWPPSGDTRADRFVRESIPRGVAGLAFGFLLAGAVTFLGGIVPGPFFSGDLGIDAFIITQATIIGGAPAGAASLLVALGLVLSFVVTFLVALWSVRRFLMPWMLGRPAMRLRIPDRRLSSLSMFVTGAGMAFVLYVSYLPLFVAVAMSFNASDDLTAFSGWSGRWYGYLVEDPAFVEMFWNALGFAILTAAVALAFVMLAARSVPTLEPRRRTLIRVVLYMALSVPLWILVLMAYFSLAIPASLFFPFNTDPWILPLSLLIHLPWAIGFAFIVTAASGDWQVPRVFGSRTMHWVRPMIAAGLVAFAATLNASIWSLGPYPYSINAWTYGIITKKILTPAVFAGITVSTTLSLAALFAAWKVLRSREPARF